ncbi:uncharacterized protein LOC131996013 [Stomoxys calcitrans]|uniref:uncharacterized protein LOC131996013 n=1 Tax=Stomoxys calcitrans TaxID=35570 RepID=UPI0027E351AD|nr:uncharacterized protein LOC131996013 [Stomoxys calcitrans]
MILQKLLLFVVIWAILANSAFAFYCYHCNSKHDEHCGYRFYHTKQMDTHCSHVSPPATLGSLFFGSSAQATGCMKQIIQSKTSGTHIVRTCYFGDIYNITTGCTLNALDVLSTLVSCDVCTDYLCNGATSIAPLAAGVLVLFLMARIFS